MNNKFELPKMIGPLDGKKKEEPFKSDIADLRRAMDFAAASAKNISVQAAELERQIKRLHGNPAAVNQATFIVSELERKIQQLREYLVML